MASARGWLAASAGQSRVVDDDCYGGSGRTFRALRASATSRRADDEVGAQISLISGGDHEQLAAFREICLHGLGVVIGLRRAAAIGSRSRGRQIRPAREPVGVPVEQPRSVKSRGEDHFRRLGLARCRERCGRIVVMHPGGKREYSSR